MNGLVISFNKFNEKDIRDISLKMWGLQGQTLTQRSRCYQKQGQALERLRFLRELHCAHPTTQNSRKIIIYVIVRVLKNCQIIICLDVSTPKSCSAVLSCSILAHSKGLTLQTQLASLRRRPLPSQPVVFFWSSSQLFYLILQRILKFASFTNIFPSSV